MIFDSEDGVVVRHNFIPVFYSVDVTPPWGPLWERKVGYK